MNKSDIGTLPIFFDRYIGLCEDLDMMVAFEKYSPKNVLGNIDELIAIGDYIYAPGKWTIKDILQHLIDNERIMCYRALRFSRNDQVALPGYEEDLLAANTAASTRHVTDLVEEWEVVRQGTILLFKNMSEEMLKRIGVASGVEISPLSLAFVILGHPVHHMNVVKERYLSKTV